MAGSAQTPVGRQRVGGVDGDAAAVWRDPIPPLMGADEKRGRPFRIAFYVKGFPRTETGGPVEVAYNLVREFLRRDGVHVTLIVQTDTEEREVHRAFGNPDRLRVIRLAYFPSMQDVRILPRLLGAIRNVDLIHFNEFPLRHFGLVLFAKARGIPTVFSLHGLLSSEAREFLGPQYPIRLVVAGKETDVRAPRVLVSLAIRLHRWTAPRWNAVVINSAENLKRAVALENVDPTRARLISNGIDLSSPACAKPSASVGRVRLLFIGKLERVKGPDLLLSALEILAQNGYAVDLSVVGEGTLEEDLRRRAGTLTGHRIVFHGYVQHDAVRQFLDWSDIVVVPSRHEGFPIVVLEAMAAGRPMVATGVGGIPEILSPPRNALLVAPNPESIAEGLQELIDDSELRVRMSRANLEDVGSYAWSAVVPRYFSLYEDVLSRAVGAPPPRGPGGPCATLAVGSTSRGGQT